MQGRPALHRGRPGQLAMVVGTSAKIVHVKSALAQTPEFQVRAGSVLPDRQASAGGAAVFSHLRIADSLSLHLPVQSPAVLLDWSAEGYGVSFSWQLPSLCRSSAKPYARCMMIPSGSSIKTVRCTEPSRACSARCKLSERGLRPFRRPLSRKAASSTSACCRCDHSTGLQLRVQRRAHLRRTSVECQNG